MQKFGQNFDPRPYTKIFQDLHPCIKFYLDPHPFIKIQWYTIPVQFLAQLKAVLLVITTYGVIVIVCVGMCISIVDKS